MSDPEDAGAEVPPDLPPVPVRVEAAPLSVIGYPLLVAVTFDNRSAPEARGLPELVPWLLPDDRLGFRLMPLDGGPEIVSPPRAAKYPQVGLTLAAGEQYRGVADLSNATVELRPGAHHLSILLAHRREVAESAAVPVELVSPSPIEAAESARLRALSGDARAERFGWWWPLFLHWGSLSVSPAIGALAQSQLALPFFLHRAILGAARPAEIDPGYLSAVTAPHLQAEVLALRLELAAARGAPDAEHLRAALLNHYPGMAHRASETGEGQIARGRRVLGAESPLAAKFPRLPYSP